MGVHARDQSTTRIVCVKLTEDNTWAKPPDLSTHNCQENSNSDQCFAADPDVYDGLNALELWNVDLDLGLNFAA